MKGGFSDNAHVIFHLFHHTHNDVFDLLANAIIVFVGVPHGLRKPNRMQTFRSTVCHKVSQSVHFFILIMYLDMLHSSAFWIRNVSRSVLHSAEVWQRLKELYSCQISYTISDWFNGSRNTIYNCTAILLAIAVCLFFRTASCLNYRH